MRRKIGMYEEKDSQYPRDLLWVMAFTRAERGVLMLEGEGVLMRIFVTSDLACSVAFIAQGGRLLLSLGV